VKKIDGVFLSQATNLRNSLPHYGIFLHKNYGTFLHTPLLSPKRLSNPKKQSQVVHITH